ncbi:ATP-binding protein [Altericista sp. CCNU0014]|uniref:ATP-binding protein n=1 Tax=Altericista sp. CCNU0014 TaxID=3082949 RepID=UPI00384C8E1A
MLAATSLVGYLSYRNDRDAIHDLADQLIDQVSDRVDQHLDTYLALPHQINQLNLDSIQRGLLNPKDLDAAGHYFFKQSQVFKHFSYIGYALPDNTSVGAGRWLKGHDVVITYHPGGSVKDYTYRPDRQGNRTKLVYTTNYNTSNDEWFKDVVKAGKPSWASISLAAAFEEYLYAPAVAPIYDAKGKLRGVLEVDLLLRDISTFLEGIEISSRGKVFIVERDGMLVATSDGSPTYRKISKHKSERISALNSSSPAIQSVSKQLLAKFGSFQNIQIKQHLDVKFDPNLLSENQFINVVPWRDRYGIDWLIITTVPESDFLGEIEANSRSTILLCLCALGLATLLGSITARWLSRPILEINAAAKAIAAGDLDQTIDIDRKDELGELSRSFNSMAHQLKTTFNTLEKTNQELDRRVQDRTASLTQTEAELRGLFSAMTDLVIVLDAQGRYLKVPTQNSPLLIAAAETLIGKTVDDMLPADLAQKAHQWIRQVLESQQALSVEYSLFIDDREAIFAANLSPISAESVIMAIRDITDLRLALRARIAAEEASRQKNAELTSTLEQLEVAQEELIQSEKMAALGQLIAGIAHEINTPLGVIQASIGNISGSLKQSLKELPLLLQNLSPEHLDAFFSLLNRAQQSKELLSSREERQLKRAFKQSLVAQGLAHADSLADILSKMGISVSLEPILPLLQFPDSIQILNAAYQLYAIENNSQNIQLAVERASRIVYALKNYIHHGISGAKTNASVTEGIDVVLILYQNQLKRGVQVTKTYETVPQLLCHPEELIQVWSNLIGNAIQAMNYDGKLNIAVSQQDRHVVVRITDSGPGIPPEIQDKIFQPFFTTKPMGEGSGLGLDIVYKIVKKHHGKIEAIGQPGQTTFSVWLPLLRPIPNSVSEAE